MDLTRKQNYMKFTLLQHLLVNIVLALLGQGNLSPNHSHCKRVTCQDTCLHVVNSDQFSQGNDHKPKYYRCKKPGHIIHDFPHCKKESESHCSSHPVSVMQVMADSKFSGDTVSSIARNTSIHIYLGVPGNQLPIPCDVLLSDSD